MSDSTHPAMVDLVLDRRSVREHYRDESVPRDTLEAIVACGLAAPSSKNAQPWRLHVLEDRQLIGELASAVLSAKGVYEYVPHDPKTGQPRSRYRSTVLASARLLGQAPVAILVENLGPFSGGRLNLAHVSPEGLRASLEGYTFEVIGLGAAIENMWLAANALGLSAAFMGDVVIAEPYIQSRLDFIGDVVGALVLGRSDGSPHPPMDSAEMADVPRVVWHSGTH